MTPPAHDAGPSGPAEPGPVLLYDGACGFCGATVRFVLRRDRRSALRFAPLQGAFAAGVAARHPALAFADSIVWVEAAEGARAERVLLRSDAVLRVARYLGGPWALLGVARVIPRALRDAAYGFVARHRHRLAGDACVVPGPGERGRFLDAG